MKILDSVRIGNLTIVLAETPLTDASLVYDVLLQRDGGDVIELDCHSEESANRLYVALRDK